MLQQEETVSAVQVKSVETYLLTESQFQTALASPYEIDSSLKVQATAIEGFQRFKCETYVEDTSFICNKF